MSKVFYFSLIAMMTMSIHNVLNLLYEFESILNSPSLFLTFEFLFFDLSYIIVSIFASIFFFGYRFNESIKYPIYCTLLQGTYIVFSWIFCIWFCNNPIKYLELKNFIWNDKKYLFNVTNLIAKYNCCGLTLNDSKFLPQCKDKQIWSCSRAIINNEGSKLRSRAFTQFSFSFIHLAALASIWITHILGGVEFEDKANSKQNSSEYHKV